MWLTPAGVAIIKVTRKGAPLSNMCLVVNYIGDKFNGQSGKWSPKQRWQSDGTDEVKKACNVVRCSTNISVT